MKGLTPASGNRNPQGDADYALKDIIELPVNIIRVCSIETEESNRMPLGKLTKNVIATNSAAHIRRYQSPSFNPKNLHSLAFVNDLLVQQSLYFWAGRPMKSFGIPGMTD
jgi:hypothetical protein